MKLLANENFPFDSVNYLKRQGFDILSIGAENKSITDKEIMNIAIEEQRIILTFDRDYGELIFKYDYKPDKGVIYLRLKQYESEEPGIIIERLLNSLEFDTNRKLTVFNGEMIRQRSY